MDRLPSRNSFFAGTCQLLWKAGLWPAVGAAGLGLPGRGGLNGAEDRCHSDCSRERGRRGTPPTQMIEKEPTSETSPATQGLAGRASYADGITEGQGNGPGLA